MATVRLGDLLEGLNPMDLEPTPDKKTIEPGTHRVQVVMARKGFSRTGRDMYTMSLVICDGPFAGRMVKWHLTVVQEHPHLLHRFFADMAQIGVSRDFFAMAHDHEDIVRRIILTGATLDVELQQGRGTFLDVARVRRVIVA